MESSEDNNTDRQLLLGNEEFAEILTWMPAKAMIKFYSLSKTLYCLLSRPSIAELQCIRSRYIEGGLFLQDMYWRPWLGSPKIEFHGSLVESSSTGIPIQSLSFLQQTGLGISASSEGLLLLHKVDFLHTKTDNFFICNPATRIYAQLPIPQWLKSLECAFLGALLECHPTNHACTEGIYNHDWADDYSVVIPVRKKGNGTEYELAVYSNGKWEEGTRNLSIQERLLRLEMPVSLFKGGLVIHYLSLRNPLHVDNNASRVQEPYMVAYDVRRKDFSRTFKLPGGAWEDEEIHHLYNSLKLLSWGTSSSSDATIGLVRIQEKKEGPVELTVWALEDYESGSWRRVIHKTSAQMGLPDQDLICSSCIGVMSNAGMMGLVFATGTRVFVYRMDSERLEVVAEHGYGPTTLMLMLYGTTLRPVSATGTLELATF